MSKNYWNNINGRKTLMDLDFVFNLIRIIFVLYIIPGSNVVRVVGLNCDIAYIGTGQTCILTLNSTSNISQNIYYIKVDFLSSGTVYNVQPIPISGFNQYIIRALPFGGYFLF